MWAMMSAPLLIAADPGQVEPVMIEQWGNEEIINVSQTFRAGGPFQGARLEGGDLSFHQSVSNGESKLQGTGSNVWGKLLPDGAFALARCAFSCRNLHSRMPFVLTPARFKLLQMCDQCHSVRASTPLPACTVNSVQTHKAFLSNEAQPQNMTCNTTCFDKIFAGGVWPPANGMVAAAAAAAAPASLAVRDLWAHVDLPTLKPPYSLTVKDVPAFGGIAIYRLTPATV
jgi:hypothetical protein